MRVPTLVFGVSMVNLFHRTRLFLVQARGVSTFKLQIRSDQESNDGDRDKTHNKTKQNRFHDSLRTPASLDVSQNNRIFAEDYQLLRSM
jgi:hypothetical protein